MRQGQRAAGRYERRVVAKSAITLRRQGDMPFPHTGSQQRRRVISTRDQRDDAAKASRALCRGHVLQALQQQLEVGRIAGVFAGIAGRTHAWRTGQRINLQA